MAMASPNSPEVFWSCHAISVGNIGDKFTNKEVVKSKSFQCERDPYPIIFEMRVSFGTCENKDTWLSAHVINTNRDVKYRKIKYQLLDNEGRTLQTQRDPEANLLSPIGRAMG